MRKPLVIISLCALLSQTSCESKKEEKEEETKFLVTSPLKKEGYYNLIHNATHL